MNNHYQLSIGGETRNKKHETAQAALDWAEKLLGRTWGLGDVIVVDQDGRELEPDEGDLEKSNWEEMEMAFGGGELNENFTDGFSAGGSIDSNGDFD